MLVYSVPSTVTLPLVQVGTSSVHISIVAFSSMTSITTGATTGVSISTVSVDTHAMLRIAVLAIAIVANTFLICCYLFLFDKSIIYYKIRLVNTFTTNWENCFLL